MEHESFENPAIAQLMNDHFVCIKVDREERPDLDQIYMNAVQLLTGRGGWPMSVFLTPDLQPFYGGTYWPPTSRMGMPGFDQVLLAVADAWKNRRSQAIEQAAELTDHILRLAELPPGGGELSRQLIDRGRRGTGAQFRFPQRRVRRRAEISASDGFASAAPVVEAASPCRVARHGDHDARQNGGRRNLRSAGRRVSSLFGRRTLAGAAFRKNAVRQRPADSRLYRRHFRRPAIRIMPEWSAKPAIMCSAI